MPTIDELINDFEKENKEKVTKFILIGEFDSVRMITLQKDNLNYIG